MGREQAGDSLLGLRGEDVESRELARGGAEVPLRDLLHRPADLHQRRDQRARTSSDDRRATIGGELAIARERLQQNEGDYVYHRRYEDHHDHAGTVVIAVPTEHAAEPEAHLD